jgi:hypothetical protein
MWAISHHAQAHKLNILITMARNVDDEALVRNCTMHELSEQAHKLSITHCAQAHELLITAATTTYVDDEILRVSTRGIHITLRNGNDDNNGDDNDEC